MKTTVEGLEDDFQQSAGFFVEVAEDLFDHVLQQWEKYNDELLQMLSFVVLEIFVDLHDLARDVDPCLDTGC